MLLAVVLGLSFTLITGTIEAEKNINEASDPQNTLRQVNIVFRHGDRTPDPSAAFNNNPYGNEKFFPFGLGELTLGGKQKAYNLGKLLRRRYKSLIGSLYYKDLMLAYSSNYNRAQMSLQAVMAALLPPSKTWRISEGLNWQPIPYTMPNPDTMISTFQACPKLFDVVTEKDAKRQDLYDYLSNITNVPITSSKGVLQIQNTLQVQDELGHALPEWAKIRWSEIQAEGMQFWADIVEQHLPGVVGNLLHKIVTDSKAKISGEAPQKLFLYSGHDLNVIAMLKAMGAYHKQYITYSAFVSLELHEIDGVYGYKAYAYNYDTPQPYILDIPNCGKFCPLDKFESEIVSNLYKGEENWCK